MRPARTQIPVVKQSSAHHRPCLRIHPASHPLTVWMHRFGILGKLFILSTTYLSSSRSVVCVCVWEPHMKHNVRSETHSIEVGGGKEADYAAGLAWERTICEECMAAAIQTWPIALSFSPSLAPSGVRTQAHCVGRVSAVFRVDVVVGMKYERWNSIHCHDTTFNHAFTAHTRNTHVFTVKTRHTHMCSLPPDGGWTNFDPFHATFIRFACELFVCK